MNQSRQASLSPLTIRITHNLSRCFIYLRLLFLLVAAQGIISCSSVPTASQTALQIDHAAHQQRLAETNHWTLKGKIGFKSATDTLSANLVWQQQQDSYQIQLSSVLGTTLMKMNGRSGFAELFVDDSYFVDTDAEQLLQRVTGWQLPVNQLKKLVKGQIPEIGFDATQTSNNLPEMVIEQAPYAATTTINKRWQIRYKRFINYSSTLWLPHDIKLTKAKNLIKIRVNSWEIHS